jgi:CRP/FNR family transcriptional regulator
MRGRYYCERCAVRETGLCSEVSETAAKELAPISHHRRIPVGQVIQSEHLGLGWLAIIVSGVVKLVKAQKDGRLQIVGLQYASDFIGHPYASKSSLTAEATTPLELCCFSRTAFEKLLRNHPSLEQALYRRALHDLDTAREWMFLLGRKNAREKLASLLVSISTRINGQPSGDADTLALQFNLPLSRNEIADALGLTIETVSRELRNLKIAGAISTTGRRGISVLNPDLLQRLAEGDIDDTLAVSPLTGL